VQFAFKPHPVLKFRLLNLWGAERTESYYRQWQTLPNTQLEEGYYNDLFLTSDAMIHDSITFTAEYIYTRKPVLFTVRDSSMENCWNEFGDKAFNLHYRAYSESDIENFINDAVLNGNDPKAADRTAFYSEYLYPKDGIMPSEKIYNILEKEITRI
jgi:CDP-glycerol glycerophosphotransferase (TagB/SpsB family)